MKNFVTNHCPGVKLSNGPRSTFGYPCPLNAGTIMKPTAGTVTRPPITAPKPSVAPSRNRLRGKRSPGSGSGIAASPRSGGMAGASVDSRGPPRSGSIAATGSPRNSFVASRAQRKPQTTAITTPIGTITIGLMISPTRMHATPAAKPIG